MRIKEVEPSDSIQISNRIYAFIANDETENAIALLQEFLQKTMIQI